MFLLWLELLLLCMIFYLCSYSDFFKEGRGTYRPKRCGNNHKDEDNSPKNLNDKNQQASSQKFRQLRSLIVPYFWYHITRYSLSHTEEDICTTKNPLPLSSEMLIKEITRYCNPSTWYYFWFNRLLVQITGSCLYCFVVKDVTYIHEMVGNYVWATGFRMLI